MRWFKPNLRNSLWGLFGGGPAAPQPEDDADDLYTIDDIRRAMSAAAASVGEEESTVLRRRIRYANDIESLWFMRGELVGLLARAHGEMVALARVEAISEMFEAQLPEGLRSRPSPLGRN